MEISNIDLNPHVCYEVKHINWQILPFYEFLNFSPEGKVLDMAKVNGGHLPLREKYEFDQIGREIVTFSQYYCENLIDHAVSIICNKYQKLEKELNSQSFDNAMNSTLKKFHDKKYTRFFDDFFKEGHLHTEELHLNRNFKS